MTIKFPVDAPIEYVLKAFEHLGFRIVGMPSWMYIRRDKRYCRVRVAFGGVMWPHEQDFSAETIECELVNLR
ncbi:MAG: hypothetical protein Q8O92_03240 [Candidatus Latescibacter sp.]|nr:hypothetical protein [Candidatus Latescibacter sp.]